MASPPGPLSIGDGEGVAKPGVRLGVIPLLLILVLAVACGAAATKAPAAPPPAAAATPTKAPIAAPTPAPKPTISAKPKVERLVVAIAPLPQETNLSWLTTSSGLLQLRPAQEFLIGVDWATGKYVPMLATKWEVASDAKSWTFQLREKVPFHFGLGDLTAKDVAHSMEMMTQTESINSDAPFWRSIIDKVEAVSDQQVVFRLKNPEVQLDEFISAERNLLMMSKALWDKEGKAGNDKRPAGTAPYQYKERKVGEYIRFELAPGKHWRIAPEAKEIDLRPTPEDVTRLAALLAGEAHISDLSRDLQKDALRRGLKVATSAIPAIHHEFFLGGQYHLTPAKYNPEVPWANPTTGKLVREALNRAVNRKEMLDTLFGGRGTLMYSLSRHPGLAGWNPEWEKQFPAKYGYDPEKAKKLLADAGYPRGFKVNIYVYSGGLPGLPEMVQTSEALGVYFQKIGLQTEITTLDFAKVRDMYRKKELGGVIWGHRSFYQTPWRSDIFYGYSGKEGFLFAYENEVFNQKFEDIRKTTDLAKRAQLQKELGDIYFNDYALIPLFWFDAEVVLDPKAVAEYRPAFTGGFFTNLETVKLAR